MKAIQLGELLFDLKEDKYILFAKCPETKDYRIMFTGNNMREISLQIDHALKKARLKLKDETAPVFTVEQFVTALRKIKPEYIALGEFESEINKEVDKSLQEELNKSK